MGKLRSLASQTAVYGISSILGRLLNYALVPLHTQVFPDSEDLGVVTGLYAYVAILMVIYTFGMETAFFRFATKDKLSTTFNTTSTAVVAVSTLFSALILLFATEIAIAIGYPNASTLIVWLAIILWIDSILAIPFARLRLENKARLFATAKMLNIIINVGLQILFLMAIPFLISNQWPGYSFIESVYNSNLGIGYIFLANLIANALLIPMLWKSVSKIRIRVERDKLKPILIYAFPILITGVAGMFNEQLDKILLEQLLPDDFYDNLTSTGAVGVYGQTFKLSIFMMLAIQAFRYAGEPFFFSNARDPEAPDLFARVMHYFVLLSLLILVLVSINVDLIGFIFLRNPEYRLALYLVPILLLGKFFYGIYINLSIWFKLTDKTAYGMYFSIAGALVTIVGNLILIPLIGYLGCAITSVLCYGSMTLFCYFKGQKHYPIPYNFKVLLPYFLVSCTLIAMSMLLEYGDFVIDSIARIFISIIIVIAIYFLEKPRLIKN
ncbi:polysaccharide biosynthesis C-terminal domain-containing protein [Fulvivirga sp. 29W222]|uniref:Polysaccharide biosynthesis C-terminal domain-containing protein n=1 Tax=Fulvivirga marina TaxID=2494733 RepID=A0A937G1T7_9BACT|nr:polysaccharide biosynthesis C-terminal domain-containing protein [Fulvivirga marina]MBL6446921.1 polysaccharide biosynthesis C-terminal domain-containing protein [Fulvivirga marina]